MAKVPRLGDKKLHRLLRGLPEEESNRILGFVFTWGNRYISMQDELAGITSASLSFPNESWVDLPRDVRLIEFDAAYLRRLYPEQEED